MGAAAAAGCGASHATPQPRLHATGCGIPPRVPGKLPAHWRARSETIGPIHLYRVREYRTSPRSDFDPLPGTRGRRFSGEKQLVLVTGGRATLSVAPKDRAVASLIYKPAQFDHGYALADGDGAVTFSDCGAKVTQWAGTFVIARARCVRFLASDPAGRRVASRLIPFGIRRCRAG
jgi:hypothetical protein